MPLPEPGVKAIANKVFLTHPIRQHSYRAAIALHAQHMLDRYVSGAPIDLNASRLKWAVRTHPTMQDAAIQGLRNSVQPIAAIANRIGSRLLRPALAKYAEHAGYVMFDAICAGMLAASDAGVVIGYENASVRTFTAARKLRKTTILDAASLHHTQQDAWLTPVEGPSLHRWINSWKDQEIALADGIITCSELARQSYIDAGVPEGSVHALPLGVDLDVFSPHSNVHSASTLRPDQPLRLVFVGHGTVLKGLPTLADALRQARAAGANIELSLVGGGGPAADALRGEPGITLQPTRAHAELADVYRQADILVLPSRFESFGMVVAESMACGTPALVSDRVGASALIRHGDNGWVFPVDDVSALTRLLIDLAAAPQRVLQARDVVVRERDLLSWQRYDQGLIGIVRHVSASKTYGRVT